MFGRGLMELCHIVNIKYHSAVRTDDGIGVLWLEPSILKYMPPWNVLDSQNIWEAPFGFHHLFNWKESYFEGFIREWRNVSREREVDKKNWSLSSKSRIMIHSPRWQYLLEGKAAASCESDLPVVFSHWLAGKCWYLQMITSSWKLCS